MSDYRNMHPVPTKGRRRRAVLPVLAGLLLVIACLPMMQKLLPAAETSPGISSAATDAPPQGTMLMDILTGVRPEAPVLEDPDTSSLTGSELSQALAERGETDTRFEKMLENRDLYPEDLLLLALKNAEAVDYAAGWPEHRNETVDAAAIDLGEEVAAGGIPLLLQWDERWGYAAYGDNLMGLAGCGPTCLSMVVLGLTGDASVNPLTVARYSGSQGWYVTGTGTDWELMRTGAAHYGLQWAELGLDENLMAQSLAAGQPIIASLGQGDFTDSGHFIVLTAYEGGSFRVLDPNSRENSGKLWSFAELSPQIRNLWCYWQ